MNASLSHCLKILALVCLCALAMPASAQNAVPDNDTAAADDAVPEASSAPDFHHRDSGDNSVVSIGHSATLEKGATADEVVAVFGSATSDGEVMDSVVSVFGDSRVTGPVGNSAVAVFGDVYVNSRVGDSVVAVLGDIVLGPNADIGGAIVDIGGSVRRDPGAIVHGGVTRVLPGIFGLHWMRPWIQQCLLYGRPLALGDGLGWVWIACLCFFALYLLLALVFPDGIERCVLTLETHPGRSVLAAILVVLFSPWLMLLLLITVIGILAVPFVLLGLACMALFGKAVVLAWLGHRCLAVRGPEQPREHAVIAVLVGGLIVTALYLVPVLGGILFNLIGMLGLGVVVYTLMLAARDSRRAQPLPSRAGIASAAAASGAAFASAAVPPQAEPPRAEPPPAAPPPGEPPPAGPAPGAAAAPSPLSSALPRAGFWIRIGALVIDALLIGAVLGFLQHSGRLEVIALAAYGAVMWKLKGTTIGGIVCGLCVVRLDDRPIDWPTAIVRALGCFLSLAVVGLGFIWIAFDDERQGWHDKIAGTVVVRAPPGVSLL